MDTAIYLVLALGHLILLAWGLRLAAQHRWWTPANLPLFVVAGLAYDNAVLAAGGFVGAGPVLQQLSVIRFWLHALVTPVLVGWALHALRRAGFSWARTWWFGLLTALAVVGLAALEYLTHLRDLRLVPREQFGVVSYASATPTQGLPVMVLLVSGVLVVAGALLAWRRRWPWLLFAALLQAVGGAVALPVPSAAAGNVLELVLLWAVLAAKARQDDDASGTVTRV